VGGRSGETAQLANARLSRLRTRSRAFAVEPDHQVKERARVAAVEFRKVWPVSAVSPSRLPHLLPHFVSDSGSTSLPNITPSCRSPRSFILHAHHPQPVDQIDHTHSFIDLTIISRRPLQHSFLTLPYQDPTYHHSFVSYCAASHRNPTTTRKNGLPQGQAQNWLRHPYSFTPERSSPSLLPSSLPRRVGYRSHRLYHGARRTSPACAHPLWRVQ
jgi:hypothetical protein